MYFNLPWPILVHAVSLVALGLNLTFKSPPKSTQKPQSDSTMLGIATSGLGLAYLATSNVPTAQNHFLYASAPVRIILAALAGLKLALGGKTLDKSLKKTLIGVLLYDGLGGILLGYYLGTWKGRAPGY